MAFKPKFDVVFVDIKLLASDGEKRLHGVANGCGCVGRGSSADADNCVEGADEHDGP